MPVQEFECQIARGQIGRYLNGEGLSAEALRQLGLHVAECSECKTFLDQRKAALQGMLGETAMPPREEVRAVVDLNPSEALIAQIRARTTEEEPAPTPGSAPKRVKPIVTKPILYCGLLAIVLVGMTYMTHNPSGLLGPNASQAIAAAPPASGAEKLVATPTPSKTPPEAKPKVHAGKKAPAPPTTTEAPTSTTPESSATNPTSTVQPPSVTIAPTKPLKSPILSAGTSAEQREATGADKPTATPKPKLSNAPLNPVDHRKATRVVTKSRWRRHWSLRHLRPGTGAIHVYHSSP